MPVFRTPHGGVLGPGGSRVGGSPDVSPKDSGGELGSNEQRQGKQTAQKSDRDARKWLHFRRDKIMEEYGYQTVPKLSVRMIQLP